ncbi:hypothetical protein SKAU_G00142440 [Synaphobranchus kaupii]|uniref:Uncharacterized protein n=1 Tax=Synaphobranchus kaupii TaxID=118154 RepID=A0A9Q1FSR3_SYNKA|nr:hypothetical protein SKAU_G00142440 [Synaphobranchus kaupii]
MLLRSRCEVNFLQPQVVPSPLLARVTPPSVWEGRGVAGCHTVAGVCPSDRVPRPSPVSAAGSPHVAGFTAAVSRVRPVFVRGVRPGAATGAPMGVATCHATARRGGKPCREVDGCPGQPV